LDWDINSQLIDIQQYLLDVTAGHSVRFLMDFTIKSGQFLPEHVVRGMGQRAWS
jgi:hypothetical protein